MGTRITIKGAATVLFCVLGFDASAEPVSVLGPLEAVSLESKAIVVLGQTYRVDAKDFSNVFATGNAREESARIPPLGTFVAVLGERHSNGVQVATTVRIVRSRYVPGATDIYLLGVAATYDATIAVAELGGARVFFGDINEASALTLRPGALVEIVGRQSHPGGLVWATAIRIVREAAAEASLQSITGTGASTQSITGTGVNTQSITGTGVSIQSITGTGVSLQSITGTGASVQSITGTGVSAQSITGTGTSLQSITGTGASS